MNRPSWAPAAVDISRPSAARVYDYYLGGTHNFEVDRRMADQAITMWPELPMMMQANRAFLGRAVHYLGSQGVTQFVDIGSGIPTAGNVHELVHRDNPDGKVVYVDNDPVAVAHSRAILSGTAGAIVVEADLRDGPTLFANPKVRALIDFGQPVALLLVALLHFVGDDHDPYGAVRRILDLLAPGSYLVVSHASSDGQEELASEHQELYRRTPTPMTMRTGEQIAGFFDGLDMVPPGLVPISLWHPDDGDAVADGPAIGQTGRRMVGYAGVGRTR